MSAPLRDEELARALEDSPWERAQFEAEVEAAFQAVLAPAPCDWCGTFEALPGSAWCEHCKGEKGGGP